MKKEEILATNVGDSTVSGSFSTEASATSTCFSTTVCCPECSSSDVERADNLTYTSNPPQYKYRCKKCGKYFWSHTCLLDSASNSFDLPPALDMPLVRPQPPAGVTRKGWECPKCGAVMSPDAHCCINCKGTGSPYRITY